MASSKLRLDHAGIGQILNSGPVASAIASLGAAVAGAVGTPTASGDPIPVTLRLRTASGGRLTARPAADITLAHAAGMAVEAKRGPLARAAAAQGLEVKSRSRGR